mgnify:CR=1 FL=1
MYLKDFKGSIDDFTKAIEIDPNDDSSYKCRGLSKKSLKDFKGALDDFNKAIEINSNLVENYLNRGIIKMSLKDFKGSFWNIVFGS